MSLGGEFSISQDEFSGIARLFPLPNLVLFPHVMQPLHLFEPRYCELLEAAVADDHLIAMATLVPGWELDYEGRPPVFPFACLGRVSVSHRLDDGSYNVLLMGLQRVRLLRELPPSKPFREAEAELCEDWCPAAEAAVQSELRRRIRVAFLHILPELPQAHEQLDQLLGGPVSLSVLTDIISYVIEIDLDDKGSLLAETNVLRRARCLLHHLEAAARDDRPGGAAAFAFPPGFSPN